MSRKDYELIAEIIRGLELDAELHDQVARAFAFNLTPTNHRFNVDRFVRACRAHSEASLGAHSEAVARASSPRSRGSSHE